MVGCFFFGIAVFASSKNIAQHTWLLFQLHHSLQTLQEQVSIKLHCKDDQKSAYYNNCTKKGVQSLFSLQVSQGGKTRFRALLFFPLLYQKEKRTRKRCYKTKQFNEANTNRAESAHSYCFHSEICLPCWHFFMLFVILCYFFMLLGDDALIVLEQLGKEDAGTR